MRNIDRPGMRRHVLRAGCSLGRKDEEMPTLGGLTELSGSGAALAAWIVGFVAWTIALWAIGTAVFRSEMARVFLRWLWRQDKSVVDEVNRLKWELKNKVAFDPELATLIYRRKVLTEAAAARSRKSVAADDARDRRILEGQIAAVEEHLSGVERTLLTFEEMEARQDRLSELGRINGWKRALTYLVNDCPFCQQFWVALAAGMLARSNGIGDVLAASLLGAGDIFATAFLYAGSASLLIRTVAPAGGSHGGQTRGTCPGGNCGH